MKITLIHGEDRVSSRNKFQELKCIAKEKSWRVTKMMYPPITSLFDDKLLYVVDGLDLLTSKEITWISKNSDKYSVHLIIYSKTEVSASTLKLLPKDIKLQKFDLPKIIFTFLESFYPGNSNKVLSLLHILVRNEPLEFVFSLLARQIRDLYWLKIDSKGPGYPDWRLKKLNTQSVKFSPEKLKDVISVLAKIDIQSKTSALDLLPSLDLLIATQLE